MTQTLLSCYPSKPKYKCGVLGEPLGMDANHGFRRKKMIPSLIYNTANKDIAKLQRVQNCLARVVKCSRFSRSVPLLKSLHWLPVHYRIIFKTCTVAYQALSSTQPAYQNSMLTPARNSRQLRSTSSMA